MATAIREQVESIPTFATKAITLRLTAEEAYALQVVFGYIGGDPTNSPRAYTDNIQRELLGVMPKLGATWNANIVDVGANIIFKTGSREKFVKMAIEADLKRS